MTTSVMPQLRLTGRRADAVLVAIIDVCLLIAASPEFVQNVYNAQMGFVPPNLETISHYAVLAFIAPAILAVRAIWSNVYCRRSESLIPCANWLVMNVLLFWAALLLIGNFFGKPTSF